LIQFKLPRVEFAKPIAMTMTAQQHGTGGNDCARDADEQPPLVVALEQALVRTDVSIEAAFGLLGASPGQFIACCRWLLTDRARFRAHIADSVEIDPSTLPYDEEVLALLAKARAEGRPLYLACRADPRYAQAIAAQLGGFAGVLESTAARDLSDPRRDAQLVEQFGAGGFDYIGARQRATPARRILEALRPVQWSKNLLVFVPAITSLHVTATSLLPAFAVFLAFSLCASAGYVFNDLVDLSADRKHPDKRRRPFAAAEVPIRIGVALIALLLIPAFLIALAVSREVAGVLAGYLAVTTAYSLVLKRKLVIDVVTLAGLYTSRVVAGAIAIGVPLSEWLLLFCILIFTALALIKRSSEMALRLAQGLPGPANRNYEPNDLPALLGLTSAAAFSAVVVFALYLQSAAVHVIYSSPQYLNFALPVLVYWLARLVVLTHRGRVAADPIVFAVRDSASWICAALMVASIAASV
jgi:4-hydroxybenzoate polyprenyltransferase